MYFYLHIPFCAQRCSYCRFSLDPRPTRAKVATYIAALLRECEEAIEEHNPRVQSIYLGGGTPSILEVDYLSRILDVFPVERRSSDCEITIECNPEDITPEKALAYKELGFTRISLGVQTLSNEALSEVGRAPAETTYRALDLLTQSGHTNINIDLILGLPHVQKWETVEALRTLHTKYPVICHTSVYLLEYEHTYPVSWQSLAISREEQYAEYAQICEALADRGWHHYEISNFAAPGDECVHNSAYWDHSPTLGLGLSAASYLDGRRWTKAASFTGYYRSELDIDESLSYEQICLERAMFGLRTFALNPAFVVDTGALEQMIRVGEIEYREAPLGGPQVLAPTLAWISRLDHIMQELFSQR